MLNPFVNAPYWDCPKCKEPYFGVLGIGEFHYTRRCAKCGHPKGTEPSASYPLPDLKKTVIYLDQCILSSMIKSLHPDRENKPDPFYLEAFKLLDRLSKLQLIVCPDSEFHEDESIFSMYPAEHKRVYELLSHGISYRDRWTILRFEIHEQLDRWLASKPMGETDLEAQRLVHGKINGWQERLIISVNSQRMENAKGQIRDTKSATFEILKEALNRWQTEADKKFDYWYREELSQWPLSIVDGYKKQYERMFKVIAGQGDPLELLPTPFFSIFTEISETLKRKTKSDQEYKEKLNQFMTSDCFEKVPFVRIFSMLMATIAARISSGHMKKEKVEASVYNDIMMISSLLPFCDAIFLEKQMAGFLRDNPLAKVIGKMPRVFSLSNKEEFLEYLRCLEKAASVEHIAAVTEVYGKDWGTPYTSVLKEYSKNPKEE